MIDINQKYSTQPTINNELQADSSLKLNSNVDANVYLGPGINFIPRITNFLYAPSTCYESVKASFKSCKIGDYEGIFENTVRSGLSSTSFFHSMTQAVSYLFEFLIILNKASDSIKKVVKVINTVLSSVGIGLCTFELGLESYATVRQLHFQKTYDPEKILKLSSINQIVDLEKRQQEITRFLTNYLPTIKTGNIIENECFLENQVADAVQDLLKNTYSTTREFCEEFKKLTPQIKQQLLASHLDTLHTTYFSLSPRKLAKIDDYVKKRLSHLTPDLQVERKNKIVAENFMRKKLELMRRMEKWLGEQICQSLEPIRKNIRSSDAAVISKAIEDACMLFSKSARQSQKKNFCHAYGLLGIGFTLLGLIVSLLGGPITVVTAILLVGGTLAFVRWGLYEGWINHHEWTFDSSACIPQAVKNACNKVFNRLRAISVALIA